MALGHISISAVSFNNEPFVRSLTATILPQFDYTPIVSDVVQWDFNDTTVWATYLDNTTYTTGTTSLYQSLSTLVFYVSADVYDHTAEQYTLFSEVISASYINNLFANIDTQATYELIYDSFPNIVAPVLYLNNENTDYSSIFYRLTANTYNARLSAVAQTTLLNPVNYIVQSQEFNNSVWYNTAPATFNKTLSVIPNVDLALDYSITADLIVPTTVSTVTSNSLPVGSISLGLSSVDGLSNSTGRSSITASNFYTNGVGVNAQFEINTTSTGIVTSVNVLSGGYLFNTLDTVSIPASTAGFTTNTAISSDFTFTITSVDNVRHSLNQSLTLPLTGISYTYSIYAKPVSGSLIYFSGFNQGDIIYDISDTGNTYNYGSWYNPVIESIDVQVPTYNRTTGVTPISAGVLALDSTNKNIYFGGSFNTYEGLSANRLIKLLPDGTQDTTFSTISSTISGDLVTITTAPTGFNRSVRAIAVDSTLSDTDLIYVGGDFTTYQGVSAYRLLRLNNDGTIDTNFNTSLTSTGFLRGGVRTVAVNSKNNVYVGGDFITYGTLSAQRIFSLSADGSVNRTFYVNLTSNSLRSPALTGFNNTVTSIVIDKNDRVYVGGYFTRFNNLSANRFTCLTPEGLTDSTFDTVNNLLTGFNSNVEAITLDNNSGIYVGGSFTSYKDLSSNRIIRLATADYSATFGTGGYVTSDIYANDGNDITFGTGFNDTVYAIAVDGQNRLYVGGEFTTYQGVSSGRIVRLNSDGSRDYTFNSAIGFNNTVTSIVVNSINEPIIAGYFTTFNGVTVPGIVNLDEYGNIKTVTDNRLSGWNRCSASFTLTGTSASSNVSIGVTTNTDSVSSIALGTESVLVWGAQINQGVSTTSTPYISTNTLPRTINYNNSWFNLNNTTNTYQLPLTSTVYTSLCSLNAATPLTSSVQVYVSANSTFDSFAPWYTPHVVNNSISAIFVPELPVADFIGFTQTGFKADGIQVVGVTTGSYTNVPGLSFYGEGHTENITLCANQLYKNSYIHNWTVGDTNNIIYPVSLTTDNLNTVYVASISSTINTSQVIPISLLLTNSFITSSGPLYYFDDVTGVQTSYPFYYSTLDLLGNENSNNNSFKRSISVATFTPPISTFSVRRIDSSENVSNTEYIPFDGQAQNYIAELKIDLAGGTTSQDSCYGIYDTLWRWSTFTRSWSGSSFVLNVSTSQTDLSGVTGANYSYAGQRNSYPYYTKNDDSNKIIYFNGVDQRWYISLTGNNVFQSLSTDYLPVSSGWTSYDTNTALLSYIYIKPNSWASMSKLSSTLIPPFSAVPATLATRGAYPATWQLSTVVTTDKPPTYTFTGNLNWLLTSTYWTVTQENSAPLPSIDFNYSLQYFDDGTLPLTTSTTNKTPIYVSTSQTAYTTISAPPYDWATRAFYYNDSKTYNILPRGEFKVYTPNRYVLTGVPVVFQNISESFNGLIKIDIDFGDNLTTTLSSADNSLYNNFSITYNELGPKTLLATRTYQNTNGSTTTVVDTFTDIVNVVSEYDIVEPVNYVTPKTPLELPCKDIPTIAPNEWAVENNINSAIEKIYNNLNYLESRNGSYSEVPTENFGWLGTLGVNVRTEIEPCPLWTWQDVDCLAGGDNIKWEDVQTIDINVPSLSTTGALVSCCHWEQHIGTPAIQNPSSYGKYCIEWSWAARKNTPTATTLISWSNTKKDAPYAKLWNFEPCVSKDGEIIIGSACSEGQWQVNIDKINDHYNVVNNCRDIIQCSYRDIASRNNIIYAALQTEVKILSSDYSATLFTSRTFIDNVFPFRDIKGIALDSKGKLFVLDGTLNQVASYNIDTTTSPSFIPFISWGGFGTSKSNNRFSRPNDICIDQLDNVWVADTGNKCIKQFSNTGSWLQTIRDDVFTDAAPPISVTIDSLNNIHVLYANGVRVYTKTGEFTFEYSFNNVTSNLPVKIDANHNREIIYIAFNDQVLRYFRNGVFAGYLVENKQCVTNITNIYQDEFRNTLVATGNKILKYVDLMSPKRIKGDLPATYWHLNDMLIHRDEYIQNWVYNKALQRLWDNIEIFRNSLIFDNSVCRSYRAPIYTKEQVSIGQNEIVTSAVVNRSIKYLWKNFNTLLDYFNPNCS